MASSLETDNLQPYIFFYKCFKLFINLYCVFNLCSKCKVQKTRKIKLRWVTISYATDFTRIKLLVKCQLCSSPYASPVTFKNSFSARPYQPWKQRHLKQTYWSNSSLETGFQIWTSMTAYMYLQNIPVLLMRQGAKWAVEVGWAVTLELLISSPPMFASSRTHFLSKGI